MILVRERFVPRVAFGTLVLAGVFLTVACAGSPSSAARGPASVPDKQAPNQIVLYLAGAERQAETDEQRREILRALEDLRTLDPAALKQRRYADYEGRAEQWTLVLFLEKYFVPRQPCSLDEATVYRDAQTSSAREVVGQQIRALRDGRQVSSVTPN